MIKVLVDMDGVLADFDGRLFEEFGPLGPDVLDCTPETQTHRLLTSHTTPLWAREMRRMIEEPGFFRDLPLIEGAQEGIDRLMSHYDVWICSKPLEASYTCASDKFAWVAEHFPGLVGKLILAPDKSLVVGDYLIDDAIKPGWVGEATWEPIVFDHPWNRQGPFSLDRSLRLHGWESIGDFLPEGDE